MTVNAIPSSTNLDSANYGYLVMASAWFFFGITWKILGATAPEKCRKTEFLTWRWKNIANSLLHSVITGIGSLICFYVAPELAEDVVDYFAHCSHLLLSFSLGYFILDFIDILTHNPFHRQTYELIVHHVAVSTCFCISMVTRRYIGYATAALVVELSNVCLHTRQLLHLYGVSRNDKVFRINSLLNLVTFVIFRIIVLAWMTRWLVINRSRVPTNHYAVGCMSLTSIIVLSTYLFYRLVTSDFYPQQIGKGESNTKIGSSVLKGSYVNRTGQRKTITKVE